MNYEEVVGFILTLIAPLFTVGIVKWLVKKSAAAVSSQFVDLPYGAKLVLGTGLTYLFFVAVKAGLVPLDADLVKQVGPALLTLVSKAIYDFLSDLIRRFKK